jgi:O-antigen/teichoic acid export membrane protein
MLPNALTAVNASLLKATHNPTLSLAFTGLVSLFIAAILTVIYHPKSAEELLVLCCYAAYLAAILSFFASRLYAKVGWQFSIQPMTKILSSCLPLWTAAIVAFVIQQFSTVIVARYDTLTELAYYSIALKIAALMSFILIAVNTVIAPKFAALFSMGKFNELKVLVGHVNQLLFIIAIGLFAFIYFSAAWLMSIFGQDFIQGAVYLKILALGQMINVGTGSVVTLLIMSDNEKLHQRNIIIIAIFTVLLAFLLIPRFGALGAAITTASAMAVQNLLSFYYVRRTLKQRFNR